MITLIKYGASSGGEKYNVNVMSIDGLSTDTKPTDKINGMTIPNGSIYTEVDTGKTFLFDVDGATWYEQSTGGGGGGTSDYTDLTNKPKINSVTLTGNKSLEDLGIAAAADIPTTAADVNAIPSSAKGAANGVAELDSNGLVPSSQLPSYVDDVLEYSSQSAFPATGETGKIYIALDTNKTYRWSGSAYVEISASLALGTTSSTAYRGDRGQTAYEHATDSSRLTTPQSSGLYKIATTFEGHVASVTAVTKTDITDLGIPEQDTTYKNRPELSGGTNDSLCTDGEKYTWNHKQSALSQAQLDAVNSGINYLKVDQIDTNKNNIALAMDANGKKQLIPYFGTKSSGNVTYTQDGTSITVTGTKESGTINYVNIITAPYNYYGLTGGDKIIVKNSDSSPVYIGIGFDTGGYTASPTLVVNGSQEITVPTNQTHMYIRIGIFDSATTIDKTITPLVCDKKLYDISPTITPYAMSNAELTAKETQNENNILSEQAKTTGMSEGGSNYITVGGIRVYVSATEPTGARTGDLWIGG